MTSSTTKNTLLGATTSQAPDFLLALLTACFSILATGNDGEATLSDQVSNLLQDNVMAVEELKLLYVYRFGFSINDALKFLGVHSDLKDYFDQQKRFSMRGGCVSLISSDAETNEETSAHDDPLCTNYGYDGDDEMVSDAESNSSSDEGEVDETVVLAAVPWKHLGARISVALCTASNEEVDDTPAHAVVPWMVVGTRIGAALRAASNTEVDETLVPPWMKVGARIGAALHAAGNEEVDDVRSVGVAVPWKVVGARIGAALRAAINEEVDDTLGPAAVPWNIVGTRVAAALRAAADEEVDGVPASPAILEKVFGALIGAAPCTTGHEAVDDTPAHTALAWRAVGVRVGAAFRAAGNEEVDDTPRPFAIPSKVVGARMSAALHAAAGDDVDEWCNSGRCGDDEHNSFAETESTAYSGRCPFDADSDSDCIAQHVCHAQLAEDLL